jgi:hypothetical protein
LSAKTSQELSHFAERTEKICLNCNANVHDRFCHVCGQENIEPKESAWHIITHIVKDVVHFDGKFFTTLRFLLFRPGFLPQEYERGRRASYLHPVKMYVFISAIFFLLFFAFGNFDESLKGGPLTAKEKLTQRIGFVDSLIGDPIDSLQRANLAILKLSLVQKLNKVDSLRDVDSDSVLQQIDSVLTDIEAPVVYKTMVDSVIKNNKKQRRTRTLNLGVGIGDIPDTIKTPLEYENWQSKLPEDKKDGWFARSLSMQQLSIINKYKLSPKEYKALLLSKFLHTLPQMFFISLPLFALMLKLLYVRRKKYYYVDHLIFGLFQYIATYALMAISMLAEHYSNVKFIGDWLDAFGIIVNIYAFYYLYKSMRNYYEQGRLKTFTKYFLLLFTMLILVGILCVPIFIYSLYQL